MRLELHPKKEQESLMSNFNLRELDLEDPQPPESTFRQGLLLGIGIVGIPALLVLTWFTGMSLTNNNFEQYNLYIPRIEPVKPD